MGAVEYEWRATADSTRSPDGGRDIDAIFERTTPDGTTERERWWIDAKARKATVSPTDIKESVLNAAGFDDVHHFVIASNSTFSNPTRDWVRKHNERKIGPTAHLWDCRRLQELVDRYPSAAAEAFKDLLGLQDLTAFLGSYFISSGRVIEDGELAEISQARQILKSDEFLLAAIYSDATRDEFDNRQWAYHFADREGLEDALPLFHFLLPRIIEENRLSMRAGLLAAAYLTGTALLWIGHSNVGALITEDDESMSDFTKSAIHLLAIQLFDLCSF